MPELRGISRSLSRPVAQRCHLRVALLRTTLAPLPSVKPTCSVLRARVVRWQAGDLYSDPEVCLSGSQGTMQGGKRALSRPQLLSSFLLGSSMLPVPLLQRRLQGVLGLFQPLHMQTWPMSWDSKLPE